MTIQSERSFSGTKFNNTSRNNLKPLFEVNFSKNSTKTIRLFALDFYEVIVDEGEGRINYHLVEIESEFLLKFTSNNGFQLFLDVLLNFVP